ncbi:MAG: hypothetical protein ACKVTZ_12500 [Bacteroidia bacterium]
MKKNYDFMNVIAPCSRVFSASSILFLFFCLLSPALKAQWFNDNMGTVISGTPSPPTWANTTPACNPSGITNNGVLVTGTNGSPAWAGTSGNGAYAWVATSAGGTSCTFTYTIFVGLNATANITSLLVDSKRDADGATSLSSFTINGTSYTPNVTTVGTSNTTHTVTQSLSINGPTTITIAMTFSGANAAASSWTNQIDNFKINGSVVVPPTVTTGSITATPSNTSFCAGQTVSVPFTKTGTFLSNNVFTAQLSGTTGSFSVPTVIGTLAGTSNGTITATIPTDALQGYRLSDSCHCK